jgi:hypothetical protein
MLLTHKSEFGLLGSRLRGHPVANAKQPNLLVGAPFSVLIPRSRLALIGNDPCDVLALSNQLYEPKICVIGYVFYRACAGA